MNGTSFDLVAFIQKSANVPEDVARNMLKNNIQAFTEPAMVEAFSIKQCDMATKTIAAPYKYLIACARKAKEASVPKETKAQRIERAFKKFAADEEAKT